MWSSKWQSEQQAAFDKLKELITCTSTLAYFDVNSNTRIVADASPVGLGAVLIQLQGVEWRGETQKMTKGVPMA